MVRQNKDEQIRILQEEVTFLNSQLINQNTIHSFDIIDLKGKHRSQLWSIQRLLEDANDALLIEPKAYNIALRRISRILENIKKWEPK